MRRTLHPFLLQVIATFLFILQVIATIPFILQVIATIHFILQVIATIPFIPGHEAVGIVVAKGSSCTVDIGTR